MAAKEIIVVPQQDTSLVLMPTMNLEQAMGRLMEFQEFVRGYMVEGEDYGKIPGTPKPTLYKPGADKLAELYGLADSYVILGKIEDFDKGLFEYTIECQLNSRRTNQLVASGLGCCSSWESKYRWRQAQRKCPKCGKEAIIKGNEQYGGGFVCWKKKDGCGAKFNDDDPAIVGQVAGRVENPDIIDLKNTVLKMAKKRAKVDAVLSATRSSGIFTQDMEDMPADGPRTEPEANDYATAGFDRDEYVKTKTAKLKQQPPAEDDETYRWRQRIANCATVEDFNGLFPDATKATKEIKKWIMTKAQACGYEYDTDLFCFYDPKERLNEQLEASLADLPRTPAPPQAPSSQPAEEPQGRSREALEPISKAEEIAIHTRRRKVGLSLADWEKIKGKYGAEHTRELQKGNLKAVLQDILDHAQTGSSKQ